MRSARAGPGETAAAPAAARSFRNERRNAFMSSSVPAKRGFARLDRARGRKFRVY
jgi:hypothetical protein